ncbi:SGNH/GDSL hydrolase family protein [Pseudomonadota bacterium]
MNKSKDSISKDRSLRQRRSRWWFYLVWLIYVCLIAEGGIRLAPLIMGRASSTSIYAGQEGSVIFSIGDSFTYGQGVEPDEAYPTVLQTLLREAGLPKDYRVVNLGIPGLSSSTALYTTAKVIQSNDAALLLVMTGWNANNNDFQRYRLAKNRLVSLTTQINNLFEYSHLYRLAKQATTFRQRTVDLQDVELVPFTTAMDLYDFRDYQEIAKKNLEQIVELCHQNEVPLLLMNYPYRDLPPNPFSKNEYYHVVFGRSALSDNDYIIANRRRDEIAIHSVIRNVAETHQVPLIDLQEAFSKSTRSDLFQDDFHHPTAHGQRLIADTVFEVIEPILRRGH